MRYKIIEKKRIFDDFFKIDRILLDIDSFGGSKLKDVTRYSLSRPEAVGVLLENASTKKIVLAEQFRYASTSHPGSTGWTLEIVAGMRDSPSETPEETGRREVLEESGYQIESLEFIASFFPSVGISDEFTHLYYSKVSSDKRIGHGGSLLDETEDIRVVEEDLETVMEKIRSGRIIDGKTIIACQWLALKRGN